MKKTIILSLIGCLICLLVFCGTGNAYVINDTEIANNDGYILVDFNETDFSTESTEPIGLMNRPGCNFYMAKSIAEAKIFISEFVSQTVYKLISCDTTETHSYFLPSNIQQTSLNNQLKTKYGIDATGTCSLIAMIIIKNFISLNNNIVIQQSNVDMLRDLYNISIQYTNKYDGSEQGGTKFNTIANIMRDYFHSKGVMLNVTDRQFNKYLDMLNNCVCPLISNIYDYIRYEDGTIGGAHSVVVCGVMNFTSDVTYKKWGWIINSSKQVTTTGYIICNGWANSNDGQIGANLQILFDVGEGHSARIQEVSDWLNYGE